MSQESPNVSSHREPPVPADAVGEPVPPSTLRLKRSPYPAAVGQAMWLAAHVKTRAWDRALVDVRATQEKQLLEIVRHSAKTEFGRANRFDRIKSYEDFRAFVRVGDYDTFSPFIEKMRKGATNLLVPELIQYYGNSSGSSTQGKPKFLPISERQIAHQRDAGADALMRYLAWRGEHDFASGFTLGLFPPITMKADGPTFVTSNPALMVTRMPRFTRPVFLPNDEHKRMTDYQEKLRAGAASYLDYDVRALSGTTCWFSLFFEHVLDAAKKQGRRARTIQDIWPNLRLLIGGGVSAAPYLPIIRDLAGREDIELIDTYNATEGGIYATSDFSENRGMRMLPHRGTFFELVPVEEHDAPSPRRFPLWEAEKGRSYAIVVTTTSGLYAYKLGDIVRLTDTERPRIEFMGRLSGCLSITQELTTHVEIERAVAHASKVCPSVTLDFGAGAEIGSQGARGNYVLFVEFQEPPKDLAAFTRAFDEGLSAENRVYREHRLGDVAITPPRVVPLVRGGAKQFMQQHTRGNVQGKFPRIVDEKSVQALFAFAAKPRAVS